MDRLRIWNRWGIGNLIRIATTDGRGITAIESAFGRSEFVFRARQDLPAGRLIEPGSLRGFAGAGESHRRIDAALP
jgi:hypothetical protein